jgi:antitoxin YefM
MRALPLAEAKAKLSQLVNEVERTDEEITITRNGRAAAVLVSFEEFASWKETLEIVSNPGLMRELRKNVIDLKRGRGKVFGDVELDRLFSLGR